MTREAAYTTYVMYNTRKGGNCDALQLEAVQRHASRSALQCEAHQFPVPDTYFGM